mmetsp:Transcript_125663/g.222662  ORF Transcript_125663/g.222662 Transcript_125663/m.222662 type:complete len:219 (-) Transcript_125663:501-1157(-)
MRRSRESLNDFRATRIGNPFGDSMTRPWKPSGRPHCECACLSTSKVCSLEASPSSSSMARRISVRSALRSIRSAFNSRSRFSSTSACRSSFSTTSARRSFFMRAASLSDASGTSVSITFFCCSSPKRLRVCLSSASPRTPRSRRRSAERAGPLSGAREALLLSWEPFSIEECVGASTPESSSSLIRATRDESVTELTAVSSCALLTLTRDDFVGFSTT